MQCVIAISLLSTITLSISLNVINKKNTLIENQKIKLFESQKQISTYQHNIQHNQIIINQQNKIVKDQTDKINLLNMKLKDAKNANQHLKDLGTFKITYYDLKYESCGKTPNDPAYGHTKSGVLAKPNVTVAVDTNVIPMGSYIYIDKIGCRIAQDTGNKVLKNHIDVFVNDFSYDKYKINQSEVYLIE